MLSVETMINYGTLEVRCIWYHTKHLSGKNLKMV